LKLDIKLAEDQIIGISQHLCKRVNRIKKYKAP